MTTTPPIPPPFSMSLRSPFFKAVFGSLTSGRERYYTGVSEREREREREGPESNHWFSTLASVSLSLFIIELHMCFTGLNSSHGPIA